MGVTLFLGGPLAFGIGVGTAQFLGGLGLLLGLLPFLIGSYWTAGAWTSNVGTRIVLAIALAIGLIITVGAIFFVGCLVMVGGSW